MTYLLFVAHVHEYAYFESVTGQSLLTSSIDDKSTYKLIHIDLYFNLFCWSGKKKHVYHNFRLISAWWVSFVEIWMTEKRIQIDKNFEWVKGMFICLGIWRRQLDYEYKNGVIVGLLFSCTCASTFAECKQCRERKKKKEQNFISIHM